MYQKLLVPLDGSQLSEQVVPYAALLGKALQAPIELLRVFDSVPQQWGDPVQGRYLDQFATSFRNEAMVALNERQWRFQWEAIRPGYFLLRARATDSKGNVQPMQAKWNFRGFANNSIHAVPVAVRSRP